MSKTTKISRRAGVEQPMSRSLRIYQKVAIVFVTVALLLLLLVLYLSISKATIHVVPVPEVVSANVSVDIAEDVTAVGQVRGFVESGTFSKSDTFSLPEEGATAMEGKAGGTVTIINETGNDQQLVATTRFLSSTGVLFRLDEGVTVPAGGSVDAVIHADEAGLSGEIGPDSFTIPGLNATLQESIYAISVESMTGGVQYTRVVTEEDLDEAADSLESEILEDAKTQLSGVIDQSIFDGSAYYTEVVEKISDTEPGSEVGSFSISLSLKVVGVFYSTETVAQAAEQGLYSQVSDGFELLSVSSGDMQASVKNVNSDSQTATLNVYADGLSVISTGSDILDKSRFTGRSASEIETLLEASDSIEDVYVTFTPFWLKRVPTLQDHIKVVVESVE